MRPRARPHAVTAPAAPWGVGGAAWGRLHVSDEEEDDERGGRSPPGHIGARLAPTRPRARCDATPPPGRLYAFEGERAADSRVPVALPSQLGRPPSPI
eukprot:4464541-Prymnesium_polylepis.1